MGFFDDVPVVSGVEDAAGTAATGAVDTFIADPGNALLGVESENQGLFEPGKAGSKALSIGTGGLAGHGGLLTDTLAPNTEKPEEQKRQQPQSQQGLPLELVAVAVGLGAILVVSS